MKTRCDTCTKQQYCTIDMFKCTKEQYSPDEETKARHVKSSKFGEVTQIARARRLKNGQAEIVGVFT